jgi:cytochrome c oxidase subunit 3
MVNNSIWPLLTAVGGFFFVSGMAFYMHRTMYGGLLILLGLIILLLSAFFWFNEIIDESTFKGNHTLVVRIGLKSGFLLFIASEIMLFLGFFWAFFHSALSPSIVLGEIWPPIGIEIIKVMEYPLLNTALLVISGFAVTWAHRGISLGSYKEAVDAFIITIFLGLVFICLQGFEYYESNFNINDSVYASSFYMLTGLHGCHVIIGVLFLCVCFIRLLLNHYLTTHYLGLIFAIWYWHFVDIVWILLFLTVYCWGSW